MPLLRGLPPTSTVCLSFFLLRSLWSGIGAELPQAALAPRHGQEGVLESVG